jgi:hypothetical protein
VDSAKSPWQLPAGWGTNSGKVESFKAEAGRARPRRNASGRRGDREPTLAGH